MIFIHHRPNHYLLFIQVTVLATHPFIMETHPIIREIQYFAQYCLSYIIMVLHSLSDHINLHIQYLNQDTHLFKNLASKFLHHNWL